MIVLLTMALMAVLFVISYYYWQLDYWKRRGISGPPARMFLGNIYSLTDVNTPVGTVLREWTKKYGNVYGIQEGLRQTLVISDLDMIRELFTTKFDYFYGRKNHVIVRDVENDPRVHIFEAQGVRWKRLRTIASSAFSTKSLRKQIYEAVDKRIEERVTKQMTRDEIAAQCFVFLVAGYDTTATSLAYVTHLLAMNPTVQKMVQEEVDEHCQETICFDTLTKMRYLDCVVKEALRMYPLASIANSRRCMESTTLNGVKVKKGEYVMVDTFSLHFDTEIWGSNATEFCPERWLDATKPPKAAFLSFGLGPRQCIGMRLAQMEAKLFLCFSYYYWQLDYWKRRGIPGPSGRMFLGNIQSMTDYNKPIALVLKEWTKIYGKVYGIQEGLRRTVVISDLEMIRELFTKKFDYFHGRKVSGRDFKRKKADHTVICWTYCFFRPNFSSTTLHKSLSELRRMGVDSSLARTILLIQAKVQINKFRFQHHVLGGDVENDARVHVFEAQGVRWKRLRSIASPAFSSGALKKIRATVEDTALALMDFFEREADKKAFDIVPYSVTEVPAVIPTSHLHRFYKEYTMDAKDVDAQQTNSEPTDFIDLFLDARAEQDFDNSKEFSRMGVQTTKQMTREEIAAQCFVFLLAGFDTTATSLAFVTHLLAKHPSIQKNLQEEIDQNCNRQSVSYETLANMKYLDCVVKEALRIYPLGTFANSRRCMKSTTLGDISVKEGEFVMADTLTLHFDREIWGDDADEFRPERWLESPVYAAFLSFGLGPRQCIGMRLAHMEEKLVLAHLLQRFDIVATTDTEVGDLFTNQKPSTFFDSLDRLHLLQLLLRYNCKEGHLSETTKQTLL
ncbi:unnamed protein product [Nippostrongylus brasiliensis]|uniref:Cytochrome P450 n=1 Tax=Nippostrongylus brasiliensis TaxID=27835 RepID=A0A158QYL1_NIPBR|nr:unnamed protein product [Nippostrongylus brasiliensis]